VTNSDHSRLGSAGVLVAIAVWYVSCSSPEQPNTITYCHSINATTKEAATGATIPITCPTAAKEFCDSVPIVATSSVQAEAACNACFGGACSNDLPCGGPGAGWYGAHAVPTPGVPISEGCFAYVGGVSGNFSCSVVGAPFPAGSIVAGAGPDTGCPTVPPSRWAP
jgi:hypothetical protein